jgi:glycosyltransferase involved in cell wall biosynthesis
MTTATSAPTYVFVVPWGLHHVGGVNQVVINLCRETTSAAELRPLVMVSDWSALRPVERVTDGRLTVYARLWSPWSDNGSIMALVKWIIASPVYLAMLAWFCHRRRVVAFNFHYASLIAFPIAVLRFFRLYRGALILSFHGLDLRAARTAGRVEGALWRFLISQATAVVGCSHAFSAEVSVFAGKRASRVHTVLNGLDVDHFVSDVDRTEGLPAALQGREFVLSVATFEHKKGLDVLVRAFTTLRQGRPGLALVLVGRPGEAEPGLRALANDLGVADDVFFCTNVPHRRVPLFLEHASVFCLPSRSEPFGIAILEAGAYRLPVVASRVGGIPEIVDDGETGLLVEPGDSDALASAVGRLLRDRKFASSLGERLHRRVRADFSWRRAYQQYRAFLPRPELQSVTSALRA